MREAVSKKIMEQSEHINSLTRVELTTLLKWHKVLKPVVGKVDERRAKWKVILESGKAAPYHEQWKDGEEGAMIKLESEAVSMRETAFCCLKEQHKQELLATFKTIPPEEEAEFMKELKSAGKEGMNHWFKKGKTEYDDDDEGVI